MGVKTFDEYYDRLKKLRSNMYMKGEKIDRADEVSEPAGVTQVAGLHGGGSPQMETITMMSRYDLEGLKNIAKYLFGIEGELPKFDRPTVTPRKMLEKFRKLSSGQKR